MSLLEMATVWYYSHIILSPSLFCRKKTRSMDYIYNTYDAIHYMYSVHIVYIVHDTTRKEYKECCFVSFC